MTKIFYLLNLLHIYEYRFHIRAVSSIFSLRLWLFRNPWSQKDASVRCRLMKDRFPHLICR